VLGAENVTEARRLKHAKEGQQGKVAYLTDDGYQWRENKLDENDCEILRSNKSAQGNAQR